MDNEGGVDAYWPVEKELCRIPDVSAARIVADATGRPVEVHILASPAKHAKQIVRDVQSVAMATFGLDLDRRIISVVQLESIPTTHDPARAAAPAPEPDAPVPPATAPPTDAPSPTTADLTTPRRATALATEPRTEPRTEPPAAPTEDVITVDLTESRSVPYERTSWTDAAPRTNGTGRRRPTDRQRVVFDGVTAVRTGTECSAQVALRLDDDQALGITEGLVVSGSILRLVAAATLAALRQIEPAARRADVETATVVRVGERLVALATIAFAVPPYEEVISGSAIVRIAGENDAMARAVLDATNRRLAHLPR